MTRLHSFKLYPLYLFLFALSGFAGLIYESLWTHYLKLLLGHAAYAQLLVLVTFMGGLSLGSWIAAQYSERIKNLLRTYAIVELCLGIAAILFHFIFLGAQSFLYDSLLPNLQSPFSIKLTLWLVAALIIFPQTVLLGATFPLMAGALTRRIPDMPGKSVAMLYFVNSFGGAIGILVSSFYFMERLGLPGVSVAAGIINVTLALIMWQLSQSSEQRISVSTEQVKSVSSEQMRSINFEQAIKNEKNSFAAEKDKKITKTLIYGLLACSFITGFSSFLYEIGWIRMLSMVLGSSTHSFEIMLSAFIIGLALGGLIIYYWLPKIQSPIAFLGYVQILMGLAALTSIPIYNHLFLVMQKILFNIARTETNYLMFSFLNQAVCFILMLPTTIAAGMTFPLITHILLKSGYGEKSVGQVYSVNTMGAILGSILALYWIMPSFGLKMVISTGAIIDILLGYLLLSWVCRSLTRSHLIAVTVVCIFYVIAIIGTVKLDAQKMASGVYRMVPGVHYTLSPVDSFKMLFHRDGKTASVSVTQIANSIQIRTNGKTDASMTLSGEPSSDEFTQILCAVIPWSLYPDAKTVGVIGIGSGMTSHTYMSIPSIRSVDTIEIEPAMVEGARFFGNRVNKVFDDPKSHIIIDDARTYLEVTRKKYDIIMSEPSNPWVSGVSSLFTEEFYDLMQKHLNQNGLFVQWLGLYELSPGLVASILAALEKVFPNYSVYYTDLRNVIVVASKRRIPEFPITNPFVVPEIKEALAHIGIHKIQLIANRRVATQRDLGKFIRSYSLVNSDFYPILDMNANKARFLDQSFDFREEINKENAKKN